MVEEIADKRKKLKYPKSVFFIISNEFCERFSFYGIRVVMMLYLRNYLNYENNEATTIYHVFVMFAYFFPVFGAILADSFLGKFRTIVYLSIVYALGQVMLTVSSTPIEGLPPREIAVIGLFLIAIGTGGIKTCVAAFGGDQFVLPQQERYLSTFFSIFYFSINAGSVLSSFLTPILRSDVSCFGRTECYPLAFFVPAMLMISSIVIFLLGKPLYKIYDPTGNVVVNVSKCVCHALRRKITSKGTEKREHWLDFADDKYERSLINDIKAALRVIKLFLPIPIFWSLFDQQGTRWIIQATRMNGEIGKLQIYPDQMQAINPFLVLVFIPLFESCIYPLLTRKSFPVLGTPLRKLAVGGMLAALSFAVSAVVEFHIEPTDPVLPSSGIAQLRLFNALKCPVPMTLDDRYKFTIEDLNMWEEKYIQTTVRRNFTYTADFSKCDEKIAIPSSGILTVDEAVANSWVLTPAGLVYYNDTIAKTKTGNPKIRDLIYVNPPETSVKLEFVSNGEVHLQRDGRLSTNETVEIKPNTYDVRANNKSMFDFKFRVGGVYALIGSAYDKEIKLNVVTLTEPNSVHILWLLPQYVIITMGEIMFSITGLEFAFTQAPKSMKALMQATWLLTTAIGNLIVVLITVGTSASFFSRMFYEFILFASLMVVSMLVFIVMAMKYKYVVLPEEETTGEEIRMDVKQGAVNQSYKDD